MTGFFSGTATAMITPFGADGGVNFNSFGEMIERQITAGTDMLVILGTTGEPATMTEEEKVSVMEYSVKKAKGRIKIVFGCGSNCTDHAVSAAKQAEAIGADGLLAVTPYYNKCTQNGLYAYYKSICEAVKIPVIAYNVPSRTGVNIQPATMARIAEIPNMAGIKDAGGNMSQTMEIFRSIRGKCDLYSGEDALNFPILAVGGSGVISVLSNVVPADVKKLYSMYNSAFLDDLTKAMGRKSFDEDLKALPEKGGYLCLFDVDKFKNINDTFGHLLGDEVLMKVVKILKSQLPVDKGKVYRFGGDEFAVIYTGGTLEELLSILKEIVHFQVGSINLSTSIGVAHSNECPTVERLKMLADERLYKSKKNGRAQISWQ